MHFQICLNKAKPSCLRTPDQSPCSGVLFTGVILNSFHQDRKYDNAKVKHVHVSDANTFGEKIIKRQLLSQSVASSYAAKIH